MRVLDFKVTGQVAERDPGCNFYGIVSHTSGYLYARFKFSADWAGCKCAAVFTSGDKEYPVPLVKNMCLIPAEALKRQSVGVSVVGKRSDGYRITSTEVRFIQQRGR